MDQQATPQATTAQAGGTLEFRVSRPGSPIRRLRLQGNRYTFGSDPTASVRLDDPSVQPLHAVLVRESVDGCERVVLKSHGLPLQVSGRSTAHTTLHVGDRFHLGQYHFEFVGWKPGENADAAAPSEERSVRRDGRGKPAPRLSFAAGMRIIDENDDAQDDPFPLRPEQTLDAIERALWSETERTEAARKEALLRREVAETLRDESQQALQRQKQELSREHRREMETLLKRFAETQQQAASANQAIDSMRRQVEDLAKQLRKATESGWRQQDELQQVREQQEESGKQLRRASSESQRLISELDAARRDRAEISASLHDATIELYKSKSEGDKAQRRARELDRQREQALQKVDWLSRRCEELSEQLQQAEQMCQSVANQRDDFAEQLQRRTEQRDAAVALADEREQELAAKETLIDNLRTQVTQLEQSVAQSQREAENLREEWHAASLSIAKLEQIVQEGEQRRQADRASWEAESADLRASVEQISLELASAASELAQSQESAQTLNAELEETRDALAQAEAEVASRPSVDQLQAIRQRLEATERQLQQLQTDADAVDAAADSISRQPQGDTDSLWAADPEGDIAGPTAEIGLVADADERPRDENASFDSLTNTSLPVSPVQDDDPTQAAEMVEQPDQPVPEDSAMEAQAMPQTFDSRLGSVEPDEALTSGWPTYDVPAAESTTASEPVTAPEGHEPTSPQADFESQETEAETTAGETLATPEYDSSEAVGSSDPWGVTDPWGLSSDEDTEPEPPQDPQPGSLANDLLRQLSGSPEPAPADAESVPRPENENENENETQAENLSEGVGAGYDCWNTYGAETEAFEQDADHTRSYTENDLEAYSEPGAYSEPASSPTSTGFDEESSMQEGEMEQVREFLDSDNDVATYGDAADEDTVDQPARAYEQPAGTETDGDQYEASFEQSSSTDDRQDEDPVGATSGASAPGDAAPQEEDEDDSIEAYMNRLLQRVQGGSSGSYSPPPSTSASAGSTSSDKAPHAETARVEPEPPIDENNPLVPRSQAPERSKNLAAMRELANDSARTAIMSSVRKQTYNAVIQKFGMAAGSAVGATVMLYYSQMRIGWQMLAAVCMTVLAAYWVVESLQMQARLRAATLQEAKEAAIGAGEEQTPPPTASLEHEHEPDRQDVPGTDA